MRQRETPHGAWNGQWEETSTLELGRKAACGRADEELQSRAVGERVQGVLQRLIWNVKPRPQPFYKQLDVVTAVLEYFSP